MVRAGARRGGACASPLTCARSNGLLYAAEEPAEKKLIYECKNCHFRKDATNARVYVHYLKNKPMCDRRRRAGGRCSARAAHTRLRRDQSRSQVYAELATDPTLPVRSALCLFLCV